MGSVTSLPIRDAKGTAGRAEQRVSKIADTEPGQKEAGCACPPWTPLENFLRPGIFWPGRCGMGVGLAGTVVCALSWLLVLAECPSACGSRSIWPMSQFLGERVQPLRAALSREMKVMLGGAGGRLSKSAPRIQALRAFKPEKPVGVNDLSLRDRRKRA